MTREDNYTVVSNSLLLFLCLHDREMNPQNDLGGSVCLFHDVLVALFLFIYLVFILLPTSYVGKGKWWQMQAN